MPGHMSRAIASLGLAALSMSCAVDDRLPTVAVSANEATPSDETVSGTTETPGQGTAGTTGAPAANAAGPDACAGLPLSRCECAVGESSTCGAEYVTTGACAARVLVCEAPGTWPPASTCAPMGPELCDPGALDDDCDGQVDEDCACINATTEACADGTERVCANGAWGPCRCGSDTVDTDQNGVADSAETLVSNGTFSTDLSGWTQSAAAEGTANGIVFARASEDASQHACSGSMLLVAWESTADNYAEQCVLAGADDYAASAQAFLVANEGADPSVPSLVTTGADPAYVQLRLSAFSSRDCQGDPLAEQLVRPSLEPVPSWQSMAVQLVAPNGTQSLRLRITTVLGSVSDPVELRSARWDNIVLHAL
jgi:hypothetical protein